MDISTEQTFQTIRKYLLFAGSEWTIHDRNPISRSSFDRNWIGIFFNEKDDENFWNGTSNSNLFCVCFNRRTPDLNQRVRDFLIYESDLGRNIVIGSNYIKDLPHFIDLALRTSIGDVGLRENDSAYVVHSTDSANWESIKTDMKLKSPNRQIMEGLECLAVGNELLGDPADFLDYIHFSPYETLHTEYVVMSREKRKIVCDENVIYTPGARIYLDHHKMIGDGLVIRDGLHYSKAKDVVDLTKYMVHCVEAPRKPKGWTPLTFYEYATADFKEYIGGTTNEERRPV